MILAALHALARQVSVEMIDELWIFPTRQSGQSESTVVVASAFVGPDDGRRRIITTHRSSRPEPGKKKTVTQETIVEQGVAPAERVARLVEGVMRRLDEELAALPPRAIQIGGETDRWEELLAELTNGTAPATPAAPKAVAPPGSAPLSGPGPQPAP